MLSNPEEKLKELLTKEKFADPTYNSTFTIFIADDLYNKKGKFLFFVVHIMYLLSKE